MRPSVVGELRRTAGPVEDVVVLQDHVADGDRFFGDERNVAVGAADGEQPGEPVIDVRGGERVQMRVIPIGPLRHGFRNLVGEGVGISRRDMQHHVVGVALRAHMNAVRVQVERRCGELLRIEGDRLSLRRVLRVEEVLDGEAIESIVVMNDERFARIDFQGRRGVKTANRHLPVRGGAADQLIAVQQKVLDRYGHGVETRLALLRRKANFEHAILAREHHRLAEGRTNCRIEFSGGFLR